MMLRCFIYLFIFLLPTFDVCGQQTIYFSNLNQDYKTAIDLFEKEKYSAAKNYFDNVVNTILDKNSLIRVESEYFSAICAIELFNNEAEELLINFVENHPESPRVKTASFFMGKYKYRKKQYNDAVYWYEKTNVDDLSADELQEYYFKRGYSYLETGSRENAEKDFYNIKDATGKYAAPALFYYSYISYLNAKNETALNGFLKLTNDETFASVVPFYICQIYFLQGKYEDVIASAPLLLADSSINTRTVEITKILAESYYRTKQYDKSISYFTKYAQTKNMSSADFYDFGYSYYQLKKYDEAIETFKKIKISNDSLSQNCLYHLADCYLQTNQKQLSMSNFYEAYKLDFDKGIKEDALFNYAKLAYELSYNPFNEAIKAFEQYINDYPNSAHKDEAYTFLVKVYLTTKNYQAAIQSIDNIKQLTPELKAAYQKVAYYSGVQLFNDGKYTDAIKYFDKSLKYTIDKKYNALANYWKADSYYRKAESSKNTEDLNLSVKFFKVFLFESGASETDLFSTVNYSLGYAYFKLQDYTSAISWFRKYTLSKSGIDEQKLYDANLRIADGYFVTKDYVNALDFYSTAINLNGPGQDYPLYQKAIVLGLTGKYEQKAQVLLQLLQKYGGMTQYEAASKYELGRAYDLMGDYDKAFLYYNKVVTSHPNFTFTPNAMLQMGNIQNKNGKYDEALLTLNNVLSKYPKNEAAYEAINIMREVCKKKGDNDCLDKLKSLGYSNITTTKLDSDNFEIAKNYFFDEKYDEALKALNKYMQKYPDGLFLTDANFYKAECEFKNGNFSTALGCYNYVTSKPYSRFTESSTAKAAYIYYKMANYDLALTQYTNLDQIAQFKSNIIDSKLGLMRCSFHLSMWDDAIAAANKLLQTQQANDDNKAEATSIIAKSYFEKKDYDKAKTEFSKLLNLQNERAAEAKYYIALINYTNAQYKESQKTCFELINQKTSYSFWVGKSFLLLSDNYLALNDRYNAKYTLKTYIEKASNVELVEQAKVKLQAIIDAENIENEKQNKQPVPDIQIEFKSNTDNDKKLFEEPKNNNGGGNQ